MYANIQNPPAERSQTISLDTNWHQQALLRLSAILRLVAQAAQKRDHSRQQYEEYSFLSSPFVSRHQWQEQSRKWDYISRRLQRYYFKKLCTLTSQAYEEVKEGNVQL